MAARWELAEHDEAAYGSAWRATEVLWEPGAYQANSRVRNVLQARLNNLETRTSPIVEQRWDKATCWSVTDRRIYYMMPTNDFMDRFVAPGYCSFNAATILDMSAVSREQGHWLTNYILNGSGLRGVSLDDGTRRTLFNFLRRTEAAFREYEAARELTLAHLAKPRHKEYVKAIDRWEQFLSQADRAWFVLVRGEKILFVKDDGSIFQRLNLLYNRTKHLETAINSEQLPPDGTIPVWLTNDGLQAVGGKLTFAEIAEILVDLAKWADAAQDPLTMRETIRVSYGLSKDEDEP